MSESDFIENAGNYEPQFYRGFLCMNTCLGKQKKSGFYIATMMDFYMSRVSIL